MVSTKAANKKQGSAGVIGDLIQAPRFRTVVQMADRRDDDLREELLESFVLTTEVAFNLVAILSSLSTLEGKGFFLQGNFGSGKSHFLSALGLLLEDPSSWDHIELEGSPLKTISISLAGRRYLPVFVSLVEHSSRERLEDIVLDEIGLSFQCRGMAPPSQPRIPPDMAALLLERYAEPLESFLEKEGLDDLDALLSPASHESLERFLASVDFPLRARHDRAAAFDRLAASLQDAGYSGVVVLIDELSEFLRSKTDARGFNEEIRFLQFLGEYGGGNPFWVVASLQERIEDTGEITQSAFNKIKDRYPGRLALTGKHLEDLISRRLLPKREGAGQRISEIYRAHSRAFTGFDPGEDRFRALYPVHPGTLLLLEDLKTLFSQHRGIVDFIGARVGGDRERRIPSMLDQPDTELLKPDVVFDHFKNRIKEMVETNPFLEVVYRFFEGETPRIFPDLEEAALALRLLKVILLGAISPIRREFTVGQLADMVLYRVTALHSDANYQYVADLLERMSQEGAYLVKEERQGEHSDVYRIDLEADVNLIIRRKVAYIRSTLFPDDGRLFTRLVEAVDAPHLPLSALSRNPKRRIQVSWQSTRREGYLLYAAPEDLTKEKVRALEDDLSSSTADFVFVLAPPGHDATRMDASPSASIAVWEPDIIGRDEREEMALILSRQLLHESLRGDTGSLAKRVSQQVELEIERDRRRLKEIFEKAYFSGRVHLPAGKSIEPARWGYIPLEQTQERVAASVLESRYPGHVSVAPLTSAFLRDREGDLVDGFFRSGEIDLTGPGARSLQTLLEGYLRPLGLLKKSGNRLMLAGDSKKSPLVAEVLDRIPEGHRTDLAGVERAVRKGRYGLSREQMRMLLLALLFSGQLSLYAEGKRLQSDKLTAFWIDRATEVSKGEVISGSIRTVLEEVPFLKSPRKAGESFSMGAQKGAWEELVAYKRQSVEWIANLEASVDKALALPSLEDLGLARARGDMDQVRAMLDSIAVSYGPREGLERFAAHFGSSPGLKEALRRTERLSEFMIAGPERFVAVAAYVRHPDLVLPDAAPFRPCRESLQHLKELIADQELPFRKDACSEFTTSFDRFVAAYCPLYAAHHEEQNSRDRFGVFDRLKTGREFALLTRLTGLLQFGLSQEFPRLHRTLSQVVSRRCSGFDPVALRVAPICRCGLRLDGEIELPDVAAMTAAFESALSDAARELTSGRIREAITACASALELAGREQDSSRLQDLLRLDPLSENLPSDLETMLAGPAGPLLKQAVEGRVRVVDRDLDRLVDRLVDRTFEPRLLLETIQQWVGQLPDGAIVRIRSERAGKEEGLLAHVDQSFPDLLPLLKDLGEERFLQALFTALWVRQVELPPESLDELMGRRDLAILLEPSADLAQHLLSRDEAAARSQLEALERRLQVSGEADRMVSLVLDGRDRGELLKIMARDQVFPFVPRHIAAVLGRSLPDSPDEELEQLASRGANGPSGESLASSARLEVSLRQAEKALTRKLDAASWEKLHRQALGFLDLDLALVKEAMEDAGVEGAVPSSRVSRCSRELEQQFSEHYRSRYSSLMGGGKEGVLTPADLISVLIPRYATRLRSVRSVCVVIDAMRHDFHDHLRDHLLPLTQGTFRHVDTLTAWAFSPTTTEPNMNALITGNRPDLPREPEEALIESPRPGREALEDLPGLKGTTLAKYNALDDRLHTSRDPLPVLFREASTALAPALLPFLDRLEPKTLLVLTADHGFRERRDPPSKRPRGAGRYTHGGVCPQQVLIPVGIYLKVG